MGAAPKAHANNYTESAVVKEFFANNYTSVVVKKKVRYSVVVHTYPPIHPPAGSSGNPADSSVKSAETPYITIYSEIAPSNGISGLV